MQLDFHTVVATGAAIAALATSMFVLLAPTLGGGSAIRWLSIGNLASTVMFAVRLELGMQPTHVGYALHWSLLLMSTAMHWAAARELAPAAERGRRAWPFVLGASLLAMCVALAVAPTAHWGALACVAGVVACHVGALRATLSIPGAHLALPRRLLAASFGCSLAFTAMHGWVRIGELLAGQEIVPATAYTWFGMLMLYCATNFGFLLLLYLGMAERVRDLARTDALTGVLNRYGLLEQLEAWRDDARAPRIGSLVAIDVDRFKSVNDTHGHGVGDEVLRWFAATLRGHLRADDLLARLGGEEFVLVLPGQGTAGARAIAERIRVELERERSAPTSVGALRVTASFGVAPFAIHGAAFDRQLGRADRALYVAKREGRNRVHDWRPTEVSDVTPA